METRRLARNLFPEPPSQSNDSVSSESTIGPMPPLTPEKSNWSDQASLKKSAAILRRSPRQTLNSPSDLGMPLESGLFTPPDRVPQAAMSTPVKAVDTPPTTPLQRAFDPTTGFPCSMFYAQSKAKTSLFGNNKFKRPVVVTFKPRHRSTGRSRGNKSTNWKRRGCSKRDRLGEINKNVWHGIKKPKPKKIAVTKNVVALKERTTQAPLQPQHATPKKVFEPVTPRVKLPSPVADPNKKFFKTNRTLEINRTATVTVDKNIKLEVSNGKITLVKTAPKKGKNPLKTRRPPTMVEPAFEPMSECDDNLKLKVDTIVDHLEVEAEDGLHRDVAALGLSPVTPPKLFSVFMPGHSAGHPSSTPRRSPRGVKRPRVDMEDDQYQIDAGQRKFGATQCSLCGLVYQLGDPFDEIQHQKHHDSLHHLKFMGWKNERVVNSYGFERVVTVFPGDSRLWLNKVMQVLELVDRELGCISFTELDLADKKVFLYIAERQVVGCLVAEPVSQGHRMLSELDGVDCCSTEGWPVVCGVSRLWTAKSWRRKKIASRLVDTMRSFYLLGSILGKDQFAFSVPTMMGKDFATSYTQTSEYLVYT